MTLTLIVSLLLVAATEGRPERLITSPWLVCCDERGPAPDVRVRDHVCGVEYAKVDRRSDRDQIEEFLYDRYRPERSRVDPGGAPIAMNQP